jgi:hypothetical protein
MNEKESYTQSLATAPVNPDRDFHRQMSDSGYGAGIAGSQGRSFARDPYESGGSFDNTMRQRERAADPFGLRNVRVDSRSMGRTKMASMDINPPEEVRKAGGIYG